MKLRAAAVSFLNARPLTAGLAGSPRIDLVLAEPSAVRRRCSRPATWTWRSSRWAPSPGRDCEIVPGIGHRRRRAGADRGAGRRGAARDLGRGLPRHRLAHLADPGQARARASAASPRVTRHMPAVEGLARAVGARRARWSSATGPSTCKQARWSSTWGASGTGSPRLPMVFAVWAARPGVLAPRGRAGAGPRRPRSGLGMRTELAQQFAREAGGDPERYRRYLTQQIRYGLGPHELDGAGDLPRPRRRGRASCRPPTLRFADDVVRSRRIRRAVSLDTALQKGADGERLDADEAEPSTRRRRCSSWGWPPTCAAAPSTPTASSPTSCRAT